MAHTLPNEPFITYTDLGFAAIGFLLGVLYGRYIRRTSKFRALAYGVLLAYVLFLVAKSPLIATVTTILVMVTVAVLLVYATIMVALRRARRPRYLLAHETSTHVGRPGKGRARGVARN
ncbi:MAG: hypothetical protein LRS43_03450 [Desulfurococcales archaeon]|nr:hypothetical protein [Desulfurococcales archaeon]